MDPITRPSLSGIIVELLFAGIITICMIMVGRKATTEKLYPSGKRGAKTATILIVIFYLASTYESIIGEDSSMRTEYIWSALLRVLMIAIVIVVPAIVTRLYLNAPINRNTANSISIVLAFVAFFWSYVGFAYFSAFDYEFTMCLLDPVLVYLILTYGDTEMNPRTEQKKQDREMKQEHSLQETILTTPRDLEYKPEDNSVASSAQVDALKALKDLHEEGVITDEEYTRKKKQILGI